MAFWRGIGGLSTIASGATVTWEIVYPGLGQLSAGTVVASPNILQSSINTELVAFDQGEIARSAPEPFPPFTHYTVKIRNDGSIPLSYNLNVADWLAGGSGPVASRTLASQRRSA
jgi:hypothetical protein